MQENKRQQMLEMYRSHIPVATIAIELDVSQSQIYQALRYFDEPLTGQRRRKLTSNVSEARLRLDQAIIDAYQRDDRPTVEAICTELKTYSSRVYAALKRNETPMRGRGPKRGMNESTKTMLGLIAADIKAGRSYTEIQRLHDTSVSTIERARLAHNIPTRKTFLTPADEVVADESRTEES